MGNASVTRFSAAALLLAAALLGGCASGPTQTHIPRPGPVVAPQPQPQLTRLPAEVEPEVQTMPLERGEVPRPQALPEPLPEPEPMYPPEGLPEQSRDMLSGSAETAPLSDNPVVVSLLEQADGLAAGGQLDRAAASVERGLRIAPKDAALWQKLARIRLEQGRYRQAESLAKKAIALARGRPGMIADNWKIIAEARRAAGDEAGARRALEKMLQYSGGMTR